MPPKVTKNQFIFLLTIGQSVMQGAEALSSGQLDMLQFALLKKLQYYLEMLEKHIDLVDRRLLKGEKIPHSEKVFSIFEPHTECLPVVANLCTQFFQIIFAKINY